jgi:hypothetical protein
MNGDSSKVATSHVKFPSEVWDAIVSKTALSTITLLARAHKLLYMIVCNRARHLIHRENANTLIESIPEEAANGHSQLFHELVMNDTTLLYAIMTSTSYDTKTMHNFFVNLIIEASRQNRADVVSFLITNVDNPSVSDNTPVLVYQILGAILGYRVTITPDEFWSLVRQNNSSSESDRLSSNESVSDLAEEFLRLKPYGVLGEAALYENWESVTYSVIESYSPKTYAKTGCGIGSIMDLIRVVDYCLNKMSELISLNEQGLGYTIYNIAVSPILLGLDLEIFKYLTSRLKNEPVITPLGIQVSTSRVWECLLERATADHVSKNQAIIDYIINTRNGQLVG